MIGSNTPLIEQLWCSPDGTRCILVKTDTAPRYSVAVLRDAVIVRERRLYGRASAHVVAQGWERDERVMARVAG